MTTSILQRFTALRKELDQLAPGRAISIVGVAKHQSIETMREAIRAGISILAHNYVQEGKLAMESLQGESVEWHFIGHIQSRKVRDLPPYQCVQSLDRLEVAEALSERMVSLQKRMRVLVEINAGGEAQKSGVWLDGLQRFLEQVSRLPGLLVEGLMGMPPALEPPESRRPYFIQMKQIFDLYRTKYPLTTLSMGTSGDYPIAIQEGSTMIRLGTSLLGARKTPEPS